MAERASIFQGVQIGAEATKGTPVPARRKLQSISINPAFTFETQQFRPSGNKFNTISITNKESSTAAVEGVIDFNEIIYLFSSILTAGEHTGSAYATYTTALTGTNNDLKFTARNAGTGGNSITIAYVDPSANDEDLSVDVVGTAITVNLATGPAGAITSTAAQIKAAIEADADASALVFVDYAGTDTGEGVVTALASTPLAGGTTAAEEEWTFNPSATAADSPVTFTIEQGSGSQAHRMARALLNSLSLSITRDELTLDGEMFGFPLADGITMTANPTTAIQAPASAAKVDVYLDTTSAGLGTTKLTRAFTVDWGLSDRFGPVWVLNSANPSFAADVETEPSGEISLMVEADTQGMGLLTPLRQGDTRFMRIEITGPTINTNPYLLRIDTAIKITNVGEFEDEDGVFAVTYEAMPTYDATWGKWCQVFVRNTLAGL